jgi:Ca2+-binding EF-hand superfamily protein
MEISDGKSTSWEDSSMKLVGNPFLPFLLVLVLLSAGVYMHAQSKESKPPSQPGLGALIYPVGSEAESLLRQIDKDHDGNITRDEWQRFFVDRDLNSDERLSPEEIHAISKQKGGEGETGLDSGRLAAFERLDVDKNNGIDLSEWPGQKKDFQYLDADRDRSLSRDEFLSRNARWWNEIFENLDFNKNGVIARSEWLDSDETFNRLDRDLNGVIDRREFYYPR